MPAPGRILSGSLSSVNGANTSGRLDYILKRICVFLLSKSLKMIVLNFERIRAPNLLITSFHSLLIELDM